MAEEPVVAPHHNKRPATGDLNGRTTIVTGAASGIGRGIAERFAEAGARVICADIDGAGADVVAATIQDRGGDGLGVTVDVTDEISVAAMTDRALSWSGRIDCAVANAGIMVGGDILSVSLEDWQKVMAVNATGAFLTARAVLPHLIAGGGGTLVFTASTVGLAGMKGITSYSAAKGAVVAMTRQLAADYAAKGVRVNAVAPGVVRTPLAESHFKGLASDDKTFNDLAEEVGSRYPIARWGEVPEIAEAVLFLASDSSSWMTGQIMPVDGGLLEIR